MLLDNNLGIFIVWHLFINVGDNQFFFASLGALGMLRED